MTRGRNRNAWLFAFTNLSFLLLISLSLVPAETGDFSLRLAQLPLPTVPASRTLQPLTAPDDPWELRIFAPAAGHATPFRLLPAQAAAGIDCNAESLIPELEKLRQRNIRPLLLPDRESLSQDFLFAAGALARVWSTAANEVVVKPLATEGKE